jgi:hypothetical protein
MILFEDLIHAVFGKGLLGKKIGKQRHQLVTGTADGETGLAMVTIIHKAPIN